MPTLSQNIFQAFRSPGSIFSGDAIAGGKLSKNFDEPTYLTFRVSFRPANTNLEFSNYDKMPHPLLELYKEDDINARNFYSTRQFLRDANEFVREQMLVDFIEKWNTLQSDFQWYFQNISGIDSLLKIDPKRGIRVPKDGKVTIKMLEGLDLKITHLLNLYRKIAWDDVYQRWILPDMMRYFMMDIYITEFRIFHQSNLKTVPAGSASVPVYPPQQTFVQKYLPELQSPAGKYRSTEVPEMILSAMDDLMPTYVLHCERCEIDIASLNTHFNDLNVSEPTMTEVSFDVNVGTLTEEYRNPLLDYYYTDRIVNGLERTREFALTTGQAIPIPVGGGIGLITSPADIPYTPTKISSNSNARPLIHPDMDYGEKGSHVSGRPFVETGGSGQSNLLNSSQATQSPTWVGNTLKFGKAFTENLLETAIGKGKMTKIPGLGVSFSEALSAIQSKNVFTVFGLVRQAMTQSLRETTPSSELEGDIVDGSFKAFLSKIAKSEATNEDSIKLAKAANQILSDRGIWEEVKDMSKATDLLSKALGEVNMGKPLENPTTLKQNAMLATNNDRSLATDLDDKPKLSGGALVYRDILLSTSTSGNLEITKAVITTRLGSTEGEIKGGEFSGASSTIEGELQPAEFTGSKPNTGIQAGGVERVQPGAATSKSGLQKAEFSGSAPNTGIVEGGLSEVSSSLATSKKDISEKGAFTGSTPNTGISEGGLEEGDLSQATKGEIANGKYLFGGVAKKQGITVQKAIERPEPGEAVDNDTKLQPIPRPKEGDINKSI